MKFLLVEEKGVGFHINWAIKKINITAYIIIIIFLFNVISTLKWFNLLNWERKTIRTLPHAVMAVFCCIFFFQRTGSLALVYTAEDLKLKVPDTWATKCGCHNQGGINKSPPWKQKTWMEPSGKILNRVNCINGKLGEKKQKKEIKGTQKCFVHLNDYKNVTQGILMRR